MTLPYAILIILMGGSAINLSIRFGVKSNLASEGMQLFMLLCTSLGYYLGIGAGSLVDTLQPAKWNFLISGILSFVGFGGLIWTINDDEFGVFFQILSSIFFIIAGFGAAIAYISSIVIVAKNFDKEVSVLLVAILITYMKTANAFDNDLEKAIMPEGSGNYQMGMMGMISALVYFGGMIFVHQVDFEDKYKAELAKKDKLGVLVFLVILAIYCLTYWVCDIFLGSPMAGFIIILLTIFFNFIWAGVVLVVGGDIFKLGNQARKDDSNANAAAKPKEHGLGDMIKKPKYIFLLLAFLLVEGAMVQY
jgi:hypothetical protein